jgi:Fic family protein
MAPIEHQHGLLFNQARIDPFVFNLDGCKQHPFADGNGRLGRILIMLSMCRAGLLSRPLLSISSYFERNRDVYYELLLADSQRGDWEPWLRLICDAIATQAEDGTTRATRLLALRRDWLERVTAPRAPAMLRESVDRLFERPAISARILGQLLNVRPQQAQRYIDRLQQLGILREITGGQYGRMYVADGVLEAIEADEPG